MIIGLTGSIGSGKSTASQRLAALGAHVLDADGISRALTVPGGGALSEIAAAFGDDVIDETGSLDRRRLARIVFADEWARLRLNGILHPMVRAQMERQTREILAADPAAVVVWDVPLLIEAGWQDACDAIWLVTAPAGLRVARVVARDGCTGEEAAARVGAQMSDGDKAQFADAVLENGSDVAAFLARVDALYRLAAGGGA